MLDLDTSNVMQEVRAAEDLRKKHLANCTQLLKRYVGNWYRTDMKTKPQPENLILTYVASTLPQIAFDNPAVACSAKRIITHEAIARFMEMGMNSWIKEVRLVDELEQCALDFLFSFAVLKAGLEPRSDYAGGTDAGVEGRFTMDALTPYLVRIPPGNTIIDSQAPSIAQARILGHMFQRDLEDLKGDDRYDQDVVARMTADDEQALGKSADERTTPKARSDVHRGRVTLYELYFPEYRQIGTLALYPGGGGKKAEASSWVRPLTDYKGPKEGPFAIFGAYVVPDQAYPLPPIAGFAEQAQELNAHAAAAAKEAAAAKKIVLVDATNAELAGQIQRAENTAVIPIKGLNAQNVVQLELGGASPERLKYMGLLLQRTDRVAGQSDAMRGRAQDVTATEATIADANGDARTDFVHRKFREGVKRGLNNVGWYLFHDPAVVMPVSMRDPTTQQPFEGLFLGGIQPGQEDASWTDIFLDIEPYSMKRVDPATEQQRAQMMLALVLEVAPAIMQFPFVNWAEILDAIGEANNIPDFAQKIFNQQGLMLIQQGGSQLALPGSMPGAGPAAMQGLPATAGPGARMAAGGAPVAGQPQAFPGSTPMQPAGGGGGGGPAGPRPGGAPPSPLQAGMQQPAATPGQPGGIQSWIQKLNDKLLAMKAVKTVGITNNSPQPGGLS